MSIPAAPPVGLDSLGELGATFVTPTRSESPRLSSSVWLGLAAGHRTMTPLAALALTNPRAGRALRIGTVVLAMAEVIVDKIPSVPKRTSPLPALARAASGATVGVLAAHRAHRRAPRRLWLGGVIGALAAIATTQFGLRLRGRADKLLPSPIAALAEDALATTLACAGVSRLRRRQNET